jgi:hypothetical protein
VAAQHIGVGLGVWLSLPAAAYLAYGSARGKWRAGYAARLPTPTTTKTNPAAIPTPPTQGGT